MLDFGLYTYEDPQVLHHLSQFARIGIPVFTHIEHQTHRQAVLDVKIHKSRILKMNKCIPLSNQNCPSSAQRKLHHELLASQTHSVRAALDEEGGWALRSAEVRQDDLRLRLVHDTQEGSSILPQQEEVLLGGNVQLAAHCDL